MMLMNDLNNDLKGAGKIAMKEDEDKMTGRGWWLYWRLIKTADYFAVEFSSTNGSS